jgi:hypothetical protein
MYSLAFFTVDLQIAKGRLLSVFEVADGIDSKPKHSIRTRIRVGAQRNGIERSSINRSFDLTAGKIGIHKSALVSRGRPDQPPETPK